ncbi:hypothetical protein F0315_01120 [Vibrio cholerae]|nr:hypothetical protein F0315_01120 [Vibrio cholerae]
MIKALKIPLLKQVAGEFATIGNQFVNAGIQSASSGRRILVINLAYFGLIFAFLKSNVILEL